MLAYAGSRGLRPRRPLALLLRAHATLPPFGAQRACRGAVAPRRRSPAALPTDGAVELAAADALLVLAASLSALLVARHLMSWHPRVERDRHVMPWLAIKRATDPVCSPFRALLDTAPVDDILSASRRPTTVDRRPAWTEGVDTSSLAALAVLRLACEPLRIALEPADGLARQVIVFQELSLLLSWCAVYARWGGFV